MQTPISSNDWLPVQSLSRTYTWELSVYLLSMLALDTGAKLEMFRPRRTERYIPFSSRFNVSSSSPFENISSN